jgi:hypothetical protein
MLVMFEAHSMFVLLSSNCPQHFLPICKGAFRGH